MLQASLRPVASLCQRASLTSPWASLANPWASLASPGVSLLLLPRQQLTTRSRQARKRKNSTAPLEALPDVLGETAVATPARHAEVLQASSPVGVVEGRRRLNVALLGIPNSGKSTLVNQLVGHFVCPESSKANTTRKNMRAIMTKEETQIVFLDTPGVVNEQIQKKFSLESRLMTDPENSCHEADLLVVVHDVSNRYVREAIEDKVLRLLCLYHQKVPAVLVLNKMDSIPKSRRVFDLIRKLTCNRLDDGSGVVKIAPSDSKFSMEKYLRRKEQALTKREAESEVEVVGDILEIARSERLSEERCSSLIAGLVGWPGFRDVFTVSALQGDGVDDLRKYLLAAAKPGQWRFDSSLKSDEDPRKTVVKVIKSKLLSNLPGGMGYDLTPEISVWEFDEHWKRLRIIVTVATKNPSVHRNLMGTKGSRVQKISKEIEDVLADLFGQEVKFSIIAKPSFTVKPPPVPQTRNVDLFL